MNRNIAERAGRWSAAHWKTATFGWLAFVLAAALAGGLAGTVRLTDAERATGESARAERMLEGARLRGGASESVLVKSSRLTVAQPAFRAELARVVGALKALSQATDVRSPLSGQGRQAVSRDGHSALVQFEVSGNATTAAGRVEPVLEQVAQLRRAAPAFTIDELGEASVAHEIQGETSRDLSHAEDLSVPVTFLVLLLAFGAFVAAAVPVILALSAVIAALGLAALASHVFPGAEATNSVIVLMGMAVGIDYSLFYLKREREERAGTAPRTALIRAAATSGRAVLISGTTVLIAMAGMLISGSAIFLSVGIGAMIVVLVSVIGSLTVLPALLGRLGDRVELGLAAILAAGLLRVMPSRWAPRPLLWLRSRPTVLARLKGGARESRVWGWLLRPALRAPALTVTLGGALLVTMAVPVLRLHTSLPGFTEVAGKVPILASYDRFQQAFPGTQEPAYLVISAGDVRAAPVQRALRALRDEALASGQMYPPIVAEVNAADTVEQVQIPLAGNGQNAASDRALALLRDRLLPATLRTVPGVSAAVTGSTAGTSDFNHTTAEHIPLVFAFVLGLAFLLLLVTFRSVVIPLTAIALNLLSVGAAYGVLVWIFQDGHLQGPLGFHANGAIVTWLPLFLFVVLFGLSMDYHVFIVTRIRELADRGVPTAAAVQRGIASTAGTVTAAAAVMVAVFALFATVSTLELQEMGVGLAVAVLLDATIIRGVMLPATMTLLGRWNWYLPRWLGWLPRTRVRPAARPVPEFG